VVKHALPTIDPGRNEFGLARTVCGCPDCVRNCRFIPGYLVPADLPRIGEQLAPDEDLLVWSRQHLLASPGAQVLRGGRVFRIPTLVPARREDGACRFLTADGRCAIHPIAPFGCAFFDSHQTGAESDRRSQRGLQAVLEDWQRGGVYAQVWAMLVEAGRVAPPPEVCRAQMRQADNPSRQEKGDV
jgi:Fe-S-cluster containining protein